MSAAMKCERAAQQSVCMTVFGHGLWFALLLGEARRPPSASDSLPPRPLILLTSSNPHDPPGLSIGRRWETPLPTCRRTGLSSSTLSALLLCYGGHAHLDSHFSLCFFPPSTNLLLFSPPSSPPSRVPRLLPSQLLPPRQKLPSLSAAGRTAGEDGAQEHGGGGGRGRGHVVAGPMRTTLRL